MQCQLFSTFDSYKQLKSLSEHFILSYRLSTSAHAVFNTDASLIFCCAWHFPYYVIFHIAIPDALVLVKSICGIILATTHYHQIPYPHFPYDIFSAHPQQFLLR